ncbi:MULTISPECIES: hypothetical protein [Psychrobacter]|uniref:hypothetical protein n=1 Tax=Psychrobacter TaxID=497 RepID=UPI00146B6920|nr:MULTISPECIES: hypothetical protein [Psychrobacter]
MLKVELFPLSLENKADGQHRSCLIKETAINAEIKEKKLWFIYPTNLPMPEDNDCDSYLLAALLPAMKMKADIIVYGSVSKELLSNLTELQYVWHKWLPEEFFLIDIKVDSIRDNETRAEGAVAAFSGGADAQFTAYRHATGKAGYGNQLLLAGVLVHGFDIPLADTKGFLGATKMASEVLENLNINLLTVSTNIRELWEINWEYYFAAGVASVLSGFKKYAGIGLVGSSEPYDALLTPWGSHPITDPLLSTGSFMIIHDGAGFSRSEKIEILSDWDLGVKKLRVCWAGGNHDSNCGKCEKCVRTRLNFLLADVVNPACFNDSLKASNFKSIILNSEGAYAEWGQIRDDIKRTGKGSKWLPHVNKVLKRKPSKFQRLLPVGSKRRTLVKKILAK